MFSWDFPYPSQRMPVLARNVVATSQPLAAQAGLAHAAREAATRSMRRSPPPSRSPWSSRAPTASAATRSRSCGTASGCTGSTPRGARRRRGPGRSVSPATAAMPQRGWDTVTVPGARRRPGSRCRSASASCRSRDLFEPAIGYARDGYTVSPIIASKWARAAPLMPQAARACRSVPAAGPRAEAGRALRLPAAGPDAAEIAATRGRSLLSRRARARRWPRTRPRTAARMTRERPRRPRARLGRAASRIDYRGSPLHEIPPNGQGIAALIALGILQQLRHRRVCRPTAPRAQHLQIEAMKLAFADVVRLCRRSGAHDASRRAQMLDEAISPSARG